MKTLSTNKFVTFRLGETTFGIEVLKTKEIVEYGTLISVPEAPDYIKGVINLRGAIVPVVDLWKKFFNQDSIKTELTSIVIVEVRFDEEDSLMGFIVDQVEDVLEIKENHFVSAPKYGSRLKSEYIGKVASIDNAFIMILNIDMVLAHVDLQENLTHLIKNYK